ncbi:uncharacterized protein LOC130277228 isoform X2 [Hyla sarda]|nr:uncharacterized protein LOC130277228 isoform X2 [Hyla sarda]XP_056383663.1 uncharacterized protein LOC130277228 isoform X2 [Hyla sarda]XP_056383664.1 uncharacterized protein LOC130277228 isoform X2 [Hyla sarda]
MPNNITVDYDGARTACAMQNSRMATLAEITLAYTKGYEICKWGWVEEKRVAMLRLTPFEACSGYNLGILMRDCPNINVAFCVNSTSGTVRQFSIPNNLVPSYENASNTCTDNGLKIATKDQIGQSNNTDYGFAWYNWGFGRMNNGIFEDNICTDVLSHASAFCYNPALSDVIIITDDQTWKKIAIGCMIASIFVILLFAAAFMRGNRFICCMGEKRTHAPESPTAPVPTWNTTSVYRRISKANKDIIYDNMVITEKRPPAIHPEMNVYKSHYSNMAFDTTGEE